MPVFNVNSTELRRMLEHAENSNDEIIQVTVTHTAIGEHIIVHKNTGTQTNEFIGDGIDVSDYESW